MPPVMLSGMRFTLAGLLLVPMLLIKKINWREQMSHWRFMLTFAIVQTFLQYGIFYMGLNLVPGALASIIIGAGPLFIAILAHFTLPNDHLSLHKLGAIALGLAGVATISFAGQDLSTSNPFFYHGIALLLISNIIGSYTNIMVVKYKEALSPILLTAFANLAGGILLFITSLFIEPTTALHTALPADFWYALIWLAIIPAAGFSAWYTLLARPTTIVSELNILKFNIPVVGVLLSWLLLPNESPTPHSIIGILFIFAAVMLLQLPQILKKK